MWVPEQPRICSTEIIIKKMWQIKNKVHQVLHTDLQYMHTMPAVCPHIFVIGKMNVGNKRPQMFFQYLADRGLQTHCRPFYRQQC